MRKTIFILLLLTLPALALRAQTVQDASYRIIGHAKGIPMPWAALYFFFR